MGTRSFSQPFKICSNHFFLKRLLSLIVDQTILLSHTVLPKQVDATLHVQLRLVNFTALKLGRIRANETGYANISNKKAAS